MTFTVIWKDSAERDLAAIWTDATDRKAITVAADLIDELLAVDPHMKGEARFGPTRILFEPPLVVQYDVYHDHRLVYVLSVKLRQRRRSS